MYPLKNMMDYKIAMDRLFARIDDNEYLTTPTTRHSFSNSMQSSSSTETSPDSYPDVMRDLFPNAPTLQSPDRPHESPAKPDHILHRPGDFQQFDYFIKTPENDVTMSHIYDTPTIRRDHPITGCKIIAQDGRKIIFEELQQTPPNSQLYELFPTEIRNQFNPIQNYTPPKLDYKTQIDTSPKYDKMSDDTGPAYQLSNDTIPKYQLSNDTSPSFRQKSDNTSPEHQFTYDISLKHKHMSRNSTDMYNKMSNDTNPKFGNMIFNDISSKYERKSNESSARYDRMTKNATPMYDIISNEASPRYECHKMSNDYDARMRRMSNDFSPRSDKISINTNPRQCSMSSDFNVGYSPILSDTASKFHQISSDTTSRCQQMSNNSSKRYQEMSNDTTFRSHQNMSLDFSLDSLQIPDDTSSSFHQMANVFNLDCPQMSNDTTSRYQQMSNDTTSKYQQMSNDTTSRYQQMSNDTTSRYQEMSNDTTSRYQQMSNKPTMRYQQMSNDTPTRYQQISKDTTLRYQENMLNDFSLDSLQLPDDTSSTFHQMPNDFSPDSLRMSNDTARYQTMSNDFSPNNKLAESPPMSSILSRSCSFASLSSRRISTPFREPLVTQKPSKNKNKMCTFCRKNGETPLVYMTHKVKEKIGGKNVVTCPILRSLICSACGAAGDDAHTISYCPVLRSSNNGQPLLSTTVTLKTTRIKSNGKRRY